MLKKVSIVIGVVILLFLALVLTRPDSFKVSRSGVIQAPPEKIYPYISQLKMGEQWSPFDTPEAKLEKTFSGNDGEAGAIMTFKGDPSKSGSGDLTLLKLVPNELVQIHLHMTEPLEASNLIEYTLQPEAGGTKFTWTMSGKNNFLGKMISVFMDCEKMVGPQMEAGIAKLRQVVEAQK